jgi:hypothetical protein
LEIQFVVPSADGLQVNTDSTGWYTTDDSYMVTLDIPKGEFAYTIIVCHQLLDVDFSYTLQTFSNAQFAISQIIQDEIFAQTTQGEWTTETSGGNSSVSTFSNNPMYRLKFKESNVQTDVMMKLSTEHKILILLLVCDNRGRRLDWIDDNAVLASTRGL